MRFLIIVKASPESEAGELPPAYFNPQMAEFHNDLARAGALLDTAWLTPSSAGWRIRHDGEQRKVIAGPFADSHELIAAYTLIQARSRDEALEWTKRFPSPRGDGRPVEIEVRPLPGLDDPPAPTANDLFGQLKMGD